MLSNKADTAAHDRHARWEAPGDALGDAQGDAAGATAAPGRAAPRVLCVSIHDVAPATWPACVRLWQALREVDPSLPLTWLVVPRYHGRCDRGADMVATLGHLVTKGHELVLHGYHHRDTGPPPATWRARLMRQVYTTREGEFAALDESEALQRIDLGLAWFAERGWPVHGFVPPAWLISPAATRALARRSFTYMTTYSGLHLLPAGPSMRAPSLVFSARQPLGRWLSPLLAHALAAALERQPLVRLSLHPADAGHASLMRHAQRLVDGLLRDRQAMTKYAFARLLQHGAIGRAGVIDCTPLPSLAAKRSAR